MKTEFCQLWLTCKNQEEATKIANTLLDKHLIACAKQIPAVADYRWKDKIEHTDEILLIMDSRPEFFKKIEAEVAKLHSYETFVLQAVQMSGVSTRAAKWIENELRNK